MPDPFTPLDRPDSSSSGSAGFTLCLPASDPAQFRFESAFPDARIIEGEVVRDEPDMDEQGEPEAYSASPQSRDGYSAEHAVSNAQIEEMQQQIDSLKVENALLAEAHEDALKKLGETLLPQIRAEMVSMLDQLTSAALASALYDSACQAAVGLFVEDCKLLLDDLTPDMMTITGPETLLQLCQRAWPEDTASPTFIAKEQAELSATVDVHSVATRLHDIRQQLFPVVS